MSPQIKAVCDRVIAMMAGQLVLEPVVDLANAAACEARWRQQNIASIAIQEFGGEAKALAQAELHRLAGEAARAAAVPPSTGSLSMVENRDGARLPSKLKDDRNAA